MPADIRSFFGGGAAAIKASQSKALQESQEKDEKTPAKKQAPKRAGRASRVVMDSESEEEVKPKKATPKKPPPKKAKREPTPEPVLEETTTSEFFGSKKKPKRSEPVKTRPVDSTPKATPKSTPKKATPAKANGMSTKVATPATNGRSSTRGRKPVTYAERDDDEDFPDDDLDGADDIFGDNFKRNGKKDDYAESDQSDDDMPIALPHRGTPAKPTKRQKKARDDDDFDPEEEDVDMKDVDQEDDLAELEEEPVTKGRSKTAGRKRKTPELDDDDDEEDEEDVPKKGRAKKPAAAKKSPVKKKAKKDDAPEDTKVQDIYDSIDLVRPPTPPPKDPDGAKFNWRANAGRANAGPSGGSTDDMPSGNPTCLAGLSFLFTGILEKWGRPEAQELVKRHGGKVVSAPSKKTSFVVLGSDAGPSKLRRIQEFSLKTINEDGLSQLITRLSASGHAGDSKAQAAHKEKEKKEQEKIEKAAAEMEAEEKRRLKAEKAAQAAASSKGATGAASSAAKKTSDPLVEDRLWTTKYAPTSLAQICGNKTTVEKLQRWLQRFPKSQKTGFKLAGPDGSGVFRAVMLHGPPGIGKTTAAHLVAKMEGYDIVESNASDTRSKKLVEEGLRGVLSTTSLHGYFSGDGKQVEKSKKKLVLIMDEVDGMSAGDRGGVGALAAVCKKSDVPMILICNERRQPKMKPFDFVTFDLPFRRPTVDQIRSRIMTIAFREGLKMPAPVVNALIEGSRADIRQVVNMISTAKMDQEIMDFDKGKQMSKSWEKHVILKPWDITSKILGGGMFAASSKATLNEKIELYFNDHEFSPLMLQENYLGTNPIRASSYAGKEHNLKLLELTSEAADSISDGDLVDRMIHGSQQHWSLMPTHAVFSFVRPASFVSGSMAGHQTRFTSWLGKNSNQQKLTRMVKEIQSHMRLRSSGDRHEVRQQYVPIFWAQLVKKLEEEGKEAVPEIIDLLDSYFLTKEDFDAIMELGVGPMDQDKVKIDTQAKATFTRLYNKQTHPLPFMKASNVFAPKSSTKVKPDLEEAIDESDDGEVIEEGKDDDEETDLSKDKYVKQPKKKSAAKKAQPQKPRGKKRAASDEDDESAEDVKPKGRGKAKAAASKGRKK
ncbi:DNA replication factor C, large subunit [Aaosphaeria arxii CBS 175.79]|uniref:Replication factor C subunit 1 n=1 Tax=Aaosphaeria arxii CBS 175.79 TaxID=1450172 RepID=A0A6A5XWK2_9PLEO|nr:DNA replication factor C, large subunit [Aaosphaeria arxii CBS 175.79]KAF2017071.1 DNA replication factor C, large subunit [Aaosphaeria arxii CBS 175.79]